MISSLLNIYIAASINTIQASKIDITKIVQNANAPVKRQNYVSPIVYANAALAIDMNSNEILFEQDANKRMPIASLTKLMTLLIVLEDNKLNETVLISQKSATVEGSTMYLRVGEEISVRNLIYGAIINSANDAAIALAEHNAGSTELFVKKMNQKAKNLGLLNTHFANPVGLDDQENYSSALDIAKLSKEIYKNEFIQKAAKISEMEVVDKNQYYTHNLKTTNKLLNSYLHIDGLKTGTTELAGQCLTTIAENEDGKKIITVVLHSPDRFQETKAIIDWSFRAYNWKKHSITQKFKI